MGVDKFDNFHYDLRFINNKKFNQWYTHRDMKGKGGGGG